MTPAMVSLCDDIGADRSLAQALHAIGAPYAGGPFHASTPSFKSYDEDGMEPCRASNRFPSFSITGPVCALNCRHCRAGVLKPMQPTGSPAAFETLLRRHINAGMQGFLLSGGSNLRNEVPFEPFLPVISRVKAEFPFLQILAHTGLVDARRAKALKDAGIDVAMLDIIGDETTIRSIYHLDRPVTDFAASLHALLDAGLTTVPHIVVGLHEGRLRGEDRALAMVAESTADTCILVVLMPHLADGGFVSVDPHEAGAFFGRARQRLANRRLLLGCARPAGQSRTLLDAYAILAGFDGIAYPAASALALLSALQRPLTQRHACCGLKTCRAA